MNCLKKTAMMTAMLACAGSLHAGEIANWGTDLVNPTSGLTTNDPVFGNGVLDQGAEAFRAWSKFGPNASPDSVSLAVGQTLTVTSGFRYTGGATNANAIRFLVGNTGTSTNNTVWAGGWTLSGVSLFSSNTNDGTGGTNTDVLSTLNTGGGNAAIVGTSVAVGTAALTADRIYNFTMSITRDSGGTVDIVASLITDNFDVIGPVGYSIQFTVNDVATSLFTYNALAFQVTGQANTELVEVLDAQYNVTPEPSSLALIGLGGLMVARRRRK